VLSAEMIDICDYYATFELLILLLANMAIIGLIRFNEKSNADGEAYFRRVPTTIFCGTVIFRGRGSGEWGVGSGELEGGVGSWKGKVIPISHSPFPIRLCC
jgi:hypothetical protein